MTISFATLFARLGKGMYVQKVVNTARGTTVPPEVKDYQDQFDSSSLELKRAMAPAEQANRSFQASAAGMMTGFRDSMANVIIEMMQADANLDRRDITHALRELVKQMADNVQSVDASTVTVTPSAVTGNGDGVLVASPKRPDGRMAENSLSESLKVECTTDSTPATASFTCRGDVAVTDRLSHDWPRGSGIAKSLSAIDADNSLLTNGNFDDEDDRPDTPDDWILSVGTIGTTIKLTDYEVQRIVISGGPSAGTYVINWTDAAGKVHSTTPLAYNASGSDVQAALRALPASQSLADVTVSTSGTSPNFTHDITFTGVAGNLTELTVTNNTTGGSFVVSTPTQGSSNAFKGKALELDANGSELTTLNQAVSLSPLRQYAFNCWMLADVVPVAGVITVDLVDGIGGSVINDEQGTANSFTINCTALTTSFVAKNGVFRTPRVLPSAVYLRIRISTAVTNTTSIFIDHAALAEMSELYSGGPWAAIFSGKSPFRKGEGQTLPDRFTLTISNDRAGEFQEWFDRNFDMRGKGLLLPSNEAGTETIVDTLIA